MVSASATEFGPSVKAMAPASAQQADLRDLVAEEPLGQRGRGENADLCVVARASQDEVDDRRIVDGRVGVRAHHEGGHAARRGGRAGAGDGLTMLGARLADEAAHVDQARRDDVARAVDDAGLGGNGIPRNRGADPGDQPVDDNKPAPGLSLALGVDEPGVEESDGLGRRHGEERLESGAGDCKRLAHSGLGESGYGRLHFWQRRSVFRGLGAFFCRSVAFAGIARAIYQNRYVRSRLRCSGRAPLALGRGRKWTGPIEERLCFQFIREKI